MCLRSKASWINVDSLKGMSSSTALNTQYKTAVFVCESLCSLVVSCCWYTGFMTGRQVLDPALGRYERNGRKGGNGCDGACDGLMWFVTRDGHDVKSGNQQHKNGRGLLLRRYIPFVTAPWWKSSCCKDSRSVH